jgi:hypothetical protein
VDSDWLDDTYIHDFTGRKMVRGYMDWFFHKVGTHLRLEAHAHRIHAGCRDISRNKDRDIMESLPSPAQTKEASDHEDILL